MTRAGKPRMGLWAATTQGVMALPAVIIMLTATPPAGQAIEGGGLRREGREARIPLKRSC
eukprot:CAMPEP_0171120918 /NCGR_PEP_ID=MMETSP0766_2-20121228/100996_1 /TAXON_ID=439317 /ORGANISM="Gambierdiscus australes, Strain CAWD 149" /LENGTH=59 /DNA_ID=CAMNT_0011583679 /DNA_START=38 /DNA_END=214 /DNA_ORIENTATION=-